MAKKKDKIPTEELEVKGAEVATTNEAGETVFAETDDYQSESPAETLDAVEKSEGKEKKPKKEKAEEVDELLEKVGTGEIIYVPVMRLTLLEANPRLIGKSELTKLSNSLESDKAYFENRPCLVNKVGDKLVVYAGNMRVRAAMNLGWRLVPCLIDEISPDLQDVRMFKDNMHAGEFNMKMLLKTFDVGFLQHDVGMTFSKADLTKYLKEDKKRAKGGDDSEDDDAFDDEGFGDDVEGFEGFEEEDDHLYIAQKFTNGTKPDALHFRQWEIPMSKGDAEWFKELLEYYRARNKSLTNFWAWFIEIIEEAEQE